MSDLEALQGRVLVSLVLLLTDAVELVEDAEDGHLRDDVLLRVIGVEGWRGEVTGQVHEGYLLHLL